MGQTPPPPPPKNIFTKNEVYEIDPDPRIAWPGAAIVIALIAAVAVINVWGCG